MNKISRQLLKIAKQIVADDYKLKDETKGFQSKQTVKQYYKKHGEIMVHLTYSPS